jgi:hypothetical protein
MATDLSKIFEEELIPKSTSNVDMTEIFNQELAPSEYSTINEDKVGTVREDVPGINSRDEAMKFAASMGFSDTYRGIKQFIGFGEQEMKADQNKLNNIFANKEYGRAALGAYMGGVVADPFGWVIPVAKAKSVSSLVKQGIAYGAGFGAVGYTDEAAFGQDTSMWEKKLYQAGLGAVGGGAITGVIGIAGKKALGFDEPTAALKATDDVEARRINKLNEQELNKEPLKDGTMDEKLTLKESYRKKVGQPLFDAMTKNPLAAGGAGLGLYTSASFLEDGNDSTNYLYNTALTAMATFAGLKAGKSLQGTEMGNKLLYHINSEIHMSPEVYSQWNKMKGSIQGHQGAIANLHNDLSGLTKEENKLAYQLFSGDLSEDGLNKIVQNHAEMGQETIDKLLKLKDKKIGVFTKLGQDMRDAGLLSDDVFKTNLDSYLKRSYQKVLETRGEKDATKLVSTLGKIRGDSIRSRGFVQKNVPKERMPLIVERLRNDREQDFKIKEDYEKRFPDGDDVPATVPNEKKGKLINRITEKDDPDYNPDLPELDQMSNYGVLVTKNEDGTYDILSQLTKQERRELGEIEDAALSIARTSQDLNTTLGLGRFYKGIEQDGISKGYVFNTTDLVGKDKQFENVNDMLENGYKVIPNTKIKNESGDNIPEFGALGGKVVPEDVYKDIKLLTEVTNNKYRKGLWNKWFKLQSFWKKTKTVYNPAVHMNNLVANFSMFYMANGSWKVFAQARKEFKEILKYERGEIPKEKLPKDLRDLYDEGGLSADMVTNEMRQGGNFNRRMDELLDSYKINGNEFMSDALDTGAKQLRKAGRIYGSADKWASDWYQLEDKIFRYSLYKTRKQQINPKTGKLYTNEEAANDAIKYFIDYDIKTPFINGIRNTAVPFLSYSYRVVPLLLETAVVRPEKFAVLAALGYTANDIFTDVAGSNKFKQGQERKLMQDFRKKKMFDNPVVDMPYSNIRLPYNGVNGGAKYFDITRKLPGGDVFDMGGDTGGDAPFLPAAAQPGGPAVSAINKLLLGRDSFTGQSFNEMGMDASEIFGSRISALAKDFVPNVPNPLVRTFAGDKITRAFNDDYQTLSDPVSKTESIASVFGLSVNTADIDRLTTLKSKELQSINSDFSKAIKKINNERMKGIIDFDEYTEEYNNLRERFTKEVKGLTKE